MIGLCSCLNTRSHQGVGGVSGSALGPCSARRAAASSELSPAVVEGFSSAAGEADGMIGSSSPSVAHGRTPEERVGALRTILLKETQNRRKKDDDEDDRRV